MEKLDLTINNESESFHKIIDNIVSDFYLVILDAVQTNAELSNVHKYLYKNIRQVLLPILVQDINEWRLESKHQKNDTNQEYIDYCYQFISKNRFAYLKNKYELLNLRIDTIISETKLNLKNFLKNIDKSVSSLKKVFPQCDFEIKKLKFIDFIGDNHGLYQSIMFEVSGKVFFYKYHGSEITNFIVTLQKEIPSLNFLKLPMTYIDQEFIIQEKVTHSSVLIKDDIEEYYHNMGKLLGILYLLNGNDMHNENIIARGKNPIVIDVETLINPIECDSDSKMDDSIFSVGMLPMKYNRNFEGIFDTSSLGQSNIVSEKVFKEYKPFTSEIQLVLIDHTFSDLDRYLPRYKENHFDVIDYLGVVEDGFIESYHLIMNHKKEIAKVISREASNINCRIVLRNTRIYSEILKFLSTPSLLKNITKAEDTLKRLLVKPRYIIHNWERYRQQEIKQLLNGEIPYFSFGKYGNTSPNDLNLSSVETSLQCKLNRFSDDDLKFQLILLRTSLNIDDDNFEVIGKENFRGKLKDLIKSSIYGTDIFTLQKDWCGNYIYGESNLGLYEGKLGIILSDNYFSDIFDVSSIRREILFSRDISFIDGRASLDVFDIINNDSILSPVSVEISNKYLDLIEGISGVILARYKFYCQKLPENISELEQLMRQFMRLYKNSSELKNGFAHGISGIKIIFYIAYQILGEEKYLDEFKKLEILDFPEKYTNGSWCNGLLGWITSEYILYTISGDKTFKENILNHLPRLMTYLIDLSDYCLCHGSFGVLDFLLTLSQKELLPKEFHDEYVKLEKYHLEMITQCRILKKDVSLFTGISGILYYLNRKESGKNSVLTFGF